MKATRVLTHAELLQLKRWNTPTIYNGWEQVTARNPAADGFNLEETRDFMPQMGPMVGYAIRDVDEMTNAGFKALARRFCVGHAYSHPVRFGCEVEVFGRRVKPGDLIHADKHGFLAVAPDEQKGLLEAARFMDSNECETLIPAARGAAGKSARQILADFDAAAAQFGKNVKARMRRKGEWA